MTDVEAIRNLLSDFFDRVRESVVDLTDGLAEEVATYRPDPAANSIAWLLWHSSRIQDDHIADLAGVEQVWPTWRDRFRLPFGPDATGYGQSADQVAAVRVSGDLLAGYHADVDRLTRRYLDGLTEAELGRVVDTRWKPPVTAGVRIVSVINDLQQHLGQAAYVRGLAARRDQAWQVGSAADR